jgi:hydrogenase nickel incorporation protein HypA/HybF
MHELSVTESILKIALKHAAQAPGKNVTAIYLVIGQLASIVDDSVQFYWEIVAQGTIAEGALLHFRRIPAELLCLDCNIRYTPRPGELACPTCSGTRIKILAGNEFYMEAIEVAEEDHQ